MSGASNYSGNITVSAGVVSLWPASGVTATYSGVISGSGALQENGLGTVVLSGANPSFTGAATVYQGQLTLNNVQALGTASNAVTISGGQVNLNVAGGTFSKPFTLNNGGILNQLAANGTYSGTINCTGAAQISSSGGRADTFQRDQRKHGRQRLDDQRRQRQHHYAQWQSQHDQHFGHDLFQRHHGAKRQREHLQPARRRSRAAR